MTKSNTIVDGQIIAYCHTLLFSKDVIFKALYWFGDRFHTTVSFEDAETYLVRLKPIDPAAYGQDDLLLHLQKFERDLIDFNLRETISRQTNNVKDLLVAKAFSNGEFDELPVGEISDPVGFVPNN